MTAPLRPFQVLSPRRTVPNAACVIDWSHPLARGLVACWLPGVMGGIDLTGNCPDMTYANGSSSTNTNVLSQEGPAWGALGSASSNSPYMWCATPPAVYNSTVLSTYYRADRNGASSNPGGSGSWALFINDNNAGSSPYVSIAMGDNNTGAMTTASGFYQHAAGTYNFTSTIDLSSAGLVSWLITWNPAGNNIQYSKGVQKTSDAWAGDNTMHLKSTSQISINTWHQFPTRLVSCLPYIICIWNRVLTAEEAAWLDADPYGFLLPANQNDLPALYVNAGTNVSATGASCTAGVGSFKETILPTISCACCPATAAGITPTTSFAGIEAYATASAAAIVPAIIIKAPEASATAAVGSITPSVTIAAIGASATASAGVGIDTVSISGGEASATASAGSIVPSISITGASASATAGAGATTETIAFTIGEAGATAGAGNLASGTASPAGAGCTAGVGIFVKGVNDNLAGAGAAAGVGNVSVSGSTSVTISGVSGVTSVGPVVTIAGPLPIGASATATARTPANYSTVFTLISASCTAGVGTAVAVGTLYANRIRKRLAPRLRTLSSRGRVRTLSGRKAS